MRALHQPRDADEHDGSITVLATHYDDKELNSPNDIIVKSDGSIYFTDPSFGRMDYYGVEREQELDWRGVYRLSPAAGSLRCSSTTSTSQTA